MSPEQLAEYAQIDLRTARRWIKEDRVPWITRQTWEQLRNGNLLRGQWTEWQCDGQFLWCPNGNRFTPAEIFRCVITRQYREYRDLLYSQRQ